MITQQPYIVCPKCGMVSHNPNDVRERYCGNCHAFHDDELIGPRTITSCVEADDGGWDCILSCGHEVVFVVQPEGMELMGCAQCIEILLERRRAKTD